MLSDRKVTILHRETNLQRSKFFMSKFAQKLIGIFFIFFILFNFPILNVFWKSSSVLGLPIIYLYIFTIWFLLILFMIWLIEFKKKQ